MGIVFEHAQYAVDVQNMLGSATAEIKATAPMTEQEMYRALVNPGFEAQMSYLTLDLFFEGGASAIQNVTWKWQMRGKGQTTWLDLHTPVTEQWTGGTATGLRAIKETAALGAHTTAPFELRLVVSASTAATITVRIGGTYKTPSVLLRGESL
jgi:hypothetical protein